MKVSEMTVVQSDTQKGVRMQDRVVFGYCRISTQKQRIERQISNIKAQYPDAIIYEEAYTGTKISRPQFDKMIDRAEKLTAKGTQVTIVFDEVSRMSRNAAEGFELYQKLFNEHIDLIFLKEPHICTSVFRDAMSTDAVQMTGTDVDLILEGVNKYMMRLAERQIELAFQTAQHEVDYLHQRTREGIEKARQAGKQIGRKEGSSFTTKKSIEAKEVIRQHSKSFGGSLDDEECRKLAGIARGTYYKYKSEIRAEFEAE